jgi:hypothetical protein
MASRTSPQPSDDRPDEDLSDLNARIAEEAAAATTADARTAGRGGGTPAAKPSTTDTP